MFAYVKSGRTRLKEKLCHALFFQTLCGINYMHKECNLVHLDIKLENLVLDANYCVKVIDFAFCEAKDE